MRKSAVTLKDIAKEMGLASSTVSRALNDHYEISEETKEAVRRVAEKLNYQPNSLALSLRSQQSKTIGVVVPEIIHFFFSTVISGIEDVAHSRGFNVIITQSNESFDRELSNIQTLSANRVDGLLISISEQTKSFEHIEKLEDMGLPVVFFDRVAPLSLGSRVIVDDFKGGYKATEHLIDQGYQKIAHLAGPQTLKIMQDRMKGYQQALEDAGLPVNPDFIIYDKSISADLAFEACLDFFKKHDVDAVFASNDISAMGIVKAAHALGKKVPADVGVMGFSNWQFTEFVNPSISTVEQPGFEIGKMATEMLLDEIMSEEEEEHKSKTLDTRLIVRESTKRGKYNTLK